jgi:hypothetical protein
MNDAPILGLCESCLQPATDLICTPGQQVLCLACFSVACCQLGEPVIVKAA